MRLWPALLFLAGCSGGPDVPPGKIVSNNPCVDAILADIADPLAVGAVSAWSHQETSGSAPLGWARQFPALGSGAEEIIAARPSLALVGGFGSTEALDRAGIVYLRFGVPATISESRSQVRAIAAAIGRTQAGEGLIGRIETATRPAPVGRSAILWLSGGFVPGRGTLQDEMLARAGFRNASAAYGLKQWDVLPLETLLASPPDVIFTPVANDGERSLLARHRALAKLRPTPQIVAFPEKLLNCGGPSIIASMAILKAAR
jgi:iron complex transport system substrate-binding protein